MVCIKHTSEINNKHFKCFLFLFVHYSNDIKGQGLTSSYLIINRLENDVTDMFCPINRLHLLLLEKVKYR